MPVKEVLLHPIRRLKSWLEGFAEKPHATVALFGCGFLEASVFPLAPDVLLIALGVTKPRKSIFYSLVVVAGSSIGALLGYYVGNLLFDLLGSHLLEFFGAEHQFQSLLQEYSANAWLVLLLAGFTALPFMVFTMAAGFNATIDPATLFFAALCGRLIRFVPIGILLYVIGPKVKYFFDHYLGRTVLAIGLVFILFIVVARYFL